MEAIAKPPQNATQNSDLKTCGSHQIPGNLLRVSTDLIVCVYFSCKPIDFMEMFSPIGLLSKHIQIYPVPNMFLDMRCSMLCHHENIYKTGSSHL